METGPGISSSIPPLADYPSDSVRGTVPPNDWRIFLDSWLLSIDYRLRLPQAQFSNLKFSQAASGVPFLLSYLRQYALRTAQIEAGSEEAKLHQRCYLLLKRLLLTTSFPYACSTTELFSLLAHGSIAFHTIADYKTTLKSVWKQNDTQVKNAIEAQKASMVKMASDTKRVQTELRLTTALLRCLPEIAVVAIAGSDYLDAMMELYTTAGSEAQEALTESFYYSLRNLMSDAQKRTSMLLDIVFELKAGAERAQMTTPTQATLLSSLVCTTSFLRHFATDPAIGDGKRGQNLIEALTQYKLQNAHLHPIARTAKGRKTKGKAKANADQGDDLHIHKASQISQIHDLFPDLPSGYILKLLDHFADDVEATIAALLEPDSLPARLQDPSADDHVPLGVVDGPMDLAPHATPPLLPERKGVFDGDNFDKLQISSSQIHRGRREMDDQPQSSDARSRNKAAIMAALAAFDADDDERDDTYDVADVGGAVDSTIDSDEKRDHERADKMEELLFRAWLANPELFNRDSKTRITNARRQLRDDTSMSDEQIEGWNIMLSRDAKLEDRLRQKYSTVRSFQGNQNSITSTRWRANASPSESQDESGDNKSDGRRVGAAGIRGRRNWNSGRGRGSTTGDPNDHATQIARKRKEQGRGRGGASHRKDGRAKKVGRGMGPVTQ